MISFHFTKPKLILPYTLPLSIELCSLFKIRTKFYIYRIEIIRFNFLRHWGHWTTKSFV